MRKILILITILSLFTVTACSKTIVSDSADSSNKKIENTGVPLNTDNRTELADVYILALDSFMPIDEGLNGDMKYIAIETQTLKNATESDKKAILEHFKKYNVEIMDESFETIKSKGMVKDLNNLEGLLLRVEKVDGISTNEISIVGSKFRSGIGAIGVNCVLKKENNRWIISSSQMTWIS